MRLITALVLATPAHAWEFTPTPICTLTHETPEARITLTYDQSLPEYTIALTLTGATWPEAPTFAMRFGAARPIAIGTDRHVLSENATTLTVTDSGFGNVLDGLQFNEAAAATTGDRTLVIPLDDAAEAVAAFRRCPEPGLS